MPAIVVLIAGANAPAAAELYSGSGNEAGSGPNDLVLADLDGDGLLDAALPGKMGDHVAVVLGQGDGTFGPVLALPVGSNPSSIAAAGFDGDGAIDLVTADQGVVTDLDGNGAPDILVSDTIADSSACSSATAMETAASLPPVHSSP